MSGKVKVRHISNRFVFATLHATISFLLILVGLGSAHAQVLYGSITGTVFDNSGAVVPNIKVNIINQQTGEVRTVTTNQAGGYVLLDVLPSAYTVEVPRTASFAAYKTEGIQLEVNRQVRVDITLQPGTVTSEVTVTSAAASLQTETAEVNADISQTQLNALP